MTDLQVTWRWGILRNGGILLMRGMILRWVGANTPLQTMIKKQGDGHYLRDHFERKVIDTTIYGSMP